MKSALVKLLLVAISLAPAIAGPAAPSSCPSSPALPDVTGRVRRPLELGDAKAAVVIFISTDCPIANGYAPEINRICKKYEKSVSFYLVHADRDLTNDAAKKHAVEYGFTCPVLIDRKHELLHCVGATVTPETVIIGAGGEVLYRGRIDDLYVALGKRRYEATTHDLRQALDEVLARKPVTTPRTEAVGCAISN